ncbi:MAG TPA: hypothetical protein VGH79_00410 [Gaiellaceae bacterium]|jgi:plastocyanin
MRKLLISLMVFALGIGGAFLALSPRAGANNLTGTITGSVGTSGSPDAYDIALSATTVAPGTYEFDITDYSSIHNFDLCKGSSCTGSNSVDKTDIDGTGSVKWTVNLTSGKYTYQCDVHHTEMQGSFTVTGGTTTTTTTPTAVAATIKSVVAKRKLVTVTAKANQPVKFTAWVLLKNKVKAMKTTTTPAASATIQLKPVPALKPGYYIVQVRAAQSSTNFKTVKKQVYVS